MPAALSDETASVKRFRQCQGRVKGIENIPFSGGYRRKGQTGGSACRGGLGGRSRPSILLLPEEPVELAQGLHPVGRGFPSGSIGELEPVAEVGGLLVPHKVRLRFPALLACGGCEETAVETGMKITSTTGAGVPA